MISVCVTRIQGCCLDPTNFNCTVGDDIVDALIQTTDSAVSAGRAYLDEEQYDMQIIEATCSAHGCIPPGSVGRGSDRVHGTYQAEVISFSVNVSRNDRGSLSAYTALKLRRQDA